MMSLFVSTRLITISKTRESVIWISVLNIIKWFI